MTLNQIVQGKLNAARTLWRMVRQLRNWPAVWSAYRSSQPAPPLEFRRGLTLWSGKFDDPVLLLQEIFSEETYHRYLKSNPQGVVLDIGANIGAVALDFALRWPQIAIHSYEPNPATFQVLKRNVIGNHFDDRVVLFNEAVAGNAGSFEMWTDVLSVGASGYMDAPPPQAKRISVPCADLATVFQRVQGRPIFLLKIDVEGAEADIFENVKDVSFDGVQHIAIECHEQLRPGALKTCTEVLRERGFRIKVHSVVEHAGISMLYGWRKS